MTELYSTTVLNVLYFPPLAIIRPTQELNMMFCECRRDIHYLIFDI